MARPIDDIAAVLRDAIIAALKDREDELKKIAEAGGDKAGGGLLSDVGSIAKIISDIAGPLEAIVGVAFPPLGVAEAVEHEAGKFGTGFGLGYMLGNVGFQALDPIFQHLNHAVADLIQSEVFDPQTVAQLQTKRIVDETYGRSEAAGGNMSGEHYDKLVAAALAFPDMLTLLTMRDRSLITDQQLTLALQRHGYPDDWLEGIRGLSRQLLSPADLALATLRGNLDESVARAYARILSITDDDFTVLVDNTGEPPGPEQLMEALRRGFIDDARFVRGIRQSRVRNEWVDVERALAHAPMSVADAVRAVVENYISIDDGAKIADQNGLLPEHWPIMVESFGRPLSREEMATLVHRGAATREQFDQAMRESDIKNKYIDLAFESARHLIPERTVVSAIDHGVLGHDEGVSKLMEQGFSQQDADILVRLGTAQRTTAAKHLSRADVVAMFEDGLLSREQATARLVTLGYAHADAVAALELADLKAKASLLKVTERGIEASLKAHHLTEQQAKTQLTAAGVDALQAQRLVDQWMLQRGTATRSLTEAQVLKLGEVQLLSPDETKARLIALGLSEGDAVLLLQLHGLIPLPAALQAKLDATATPPATP